MRSSCRRMSRRPPKENPSCAASLWWWALAILPGLYVIADFFEDILIVHLLENPDAIPGRFDLLRKVTSWKMRTSIGSFAQLAILFAALFALGSSPPLSTP